MLDADRADYADAVRSYLNKIVDAGVQLTHWWTFRSDRQGFNDGEGWRNDSGEVLEAIIAADRSLTEKYRVNGVGSENTDHIRNDTDYDVFDPAGVISGATEGDQSQGRAHHITDPGRRGAGAVCRCGIYIQKAHIAQQKLRK